jgi:MFS family permease
MTARDDGANRTILFVNWAHALDHFVLLIFPTAVIAIAADLHRDYGDLIWLSTGAFVSFGLFALPVGWLADRFGRRALLTAYFFGYGAACLLVAASFSFTTLAAALFLVGVFSAIYHPIGSAMIIANAKQMGRALGVNGVWGNMGAALASGISAALAASFGWRSAFFVPGAALIATGLAFVLLVRDNLVAGKKGAPSHTLDIGRKRLISLVALFMAAILAGGLTFNIVTIAMPKVIDERLGLPIPLAVTGWLTTAIFFCGALAQIAVGRLVDRMELPPIFVGLGLMQFGGLAATAGTTGLPMAAGLTLVTAAIYGQVVVNDAMIGRYVPDEMRNRIYSLRFFFGFTVGGLAVPIIGALHKRGGFDAVLIVTAAIAGVIFACAIGTWALARGRSQLAASPAERSLPLRGNQASAPLVSER